MLDRRRSKQQTSELGVSAPMLFPDAAEQVPGLSTSGLIPLSSILLRTGVRARNRGSIRYFAAPESITGISRFSRERMLAKGWGSSSGLNFSTYTTIRISLCPPLALEPRDSA